MHAHPTLDAANEGVRLVQGQVVAGVLAQAPQDRIQG